MEENQPDPWSDYVPEETKPEWMEQILEDSVVSPHFSDCTWQSDSSTNQLRFDDELSGVTLSPVTLRKNYDPVLCKGLTSNAVIRYTSYGTSQHPTEHNQSLKRIVLVLLLLIGAMLIAFGVGLIVHVLLMESKGPTEHAWYTAKVSVPILNHSYIQNYKDINSPEFQAIALPFCNEIDVYLESSVAADRYEGCTVKSIREKENSFDNLSCNCSEIITLSSQPVTVQFDLSLSGYIESDTIAEIVRNKTQKVIYRDFQLSLIKDFVVAVAHAPDTEGMKDNCRLSNDVCLNGGTCSDTKGNFVCSCLNGWTGNRCENDINECNSTISLCSRGSCENTDGSYICVCPNGWTGQNCDIDINECNNTRPSCSRGTCENMEGSYFCICPRGWTGQDCDIDLNECNNTVTPCVRGKCMNMDGSYLCDCPNGWAGQNCEKDIDECNMNPSICEHGGTCINSDGGFMCLCLPGWEGENCHDNFDECTIFPCRHGGMCTDMPGSYTCDCQPGWYGTKCEIDWDECKIDPCRNNATCVNTGGSFTCTCAEGWQGMLCDIDINECTSFNTCKNGATCNNEDGSYVCACPAGFVGRNCDKDINECSVFDICKNGGACKNTFGSYNCKCHQGFTGTHCENDIDECVENSRCLNGAICENQNGSYTCHCARGYNGQHCENDINECSVFGICKNGGTCKNSFGSYECNCQQGFTGIHCENDIDECIENSLCLNGATCENQNGTHTCHCASGYNGQHCENDINECSVFDICKNGGTCKNSFGSYRCNCHQGFTGTHCENDIDECIENSRCLNGATCENQNGSYTCHCAIGYNGQHCENDINECSVFDICKNGGTCKNSFGSYECNCQQGFRGTHCENDIDECIENSLCLNDATCENQNGSYTCHCASGYNGQHCENDINECSVFDICKNDGTCKNTFGSYECNCHQGFSGKQCENDIDECVEYSRCLNGATCENQNGSYTCHCASGYSGQHCDNDINDCSSSPCQNGGTCIDGIASHTCVCDDAYTGHNCQSNITTVISYSSRVLNLTFTPELQNRSSSLFLDLARTFINDVDNTMTNNNTAFPFYDKTRISTFKPDAKTLEWELHFTGLVSQTTKYRAHDYILKTKTPIIYGDALAVQIGDILLFLNTYNTTNVMMNFRLLNFTMAADLTYNTTSDFLDHQVAVCNDIDEIMEFFRKKFSTYKHCSIQTFTNSTRDVAVNLLFEEDLPKERLHTEVVRSIISTLPLVPFKESLGFNLGNFLVFHKYRTDITTNPMTFQILNLTWTSDFSDKDSRIFKFHSKSFCDAIDRILEQSSSLSSYEFCTVDSFGRVPLNITMHVGFKTKNISTETSKIISDLIYTNTPVVHYNGTIGHLVGSLLVFYDKWDITHYDAWLSNTTFYIHDFRYDPNYMDPDSKPFKTLQNKFCSDVNRFFANSTLSRRYYSCSVKNIGSKIPHTITFQMVFNDTEVLPQNTLIEIINSSAPHVFIEKTNMMYIGEQVYYVKDEFDHVAINISDFTTTTFIPPTDTPVDIFINVTLVILNLNYTADLADPTSLTFRNLTEPFCAFLDKLYKGRFAQQKYAGCYVNFFTKVPTEQINFLLKFKGTVNDDLRKNVYGAVIENAPRDTVNGQIAIMVGPLAIYEESMVVNM